MYALWQPIPETMIKALFNAISTDQALLDQASNQNLTRARSVESMIEP
jgi:hypothetical protein